MLNRTIQTIALPCLLVTLCVAVFLGVLSAPTVAHAQQSLYDRVVEALVPCGNTITHTDTGGEICYTGECTTCHLLELARRIMNLFVFLGVVLATLLFVNAGALYLGTAANAGNVARAHKIFVNTLIGLIIVLAAWLVIDVTMKTLTGERGQSFGPWNSILCKAPADTANCFPKMEGLNVNVEGEAWNPLNPNLKLAGGKDASYSTDGGKSQGTPNLAPAQFGSVPGSIQVKAGACKDNPCKINEDYAKQLTRFSGKLCGSGEGICPGEWRVTEFNGYDGHISTCHALGECADINFTGDATPEKILQVQKAAKDLGMCAVWETGSAKDVAALRAQGATDIWHDTKGHITSPHFSLYKDRSNRNCAK